MRSEKYIPHYTVSDYMLWEGQWELIDGVPSAMSPSPVRKHQTFQAILMRQLGNNMDEQSTVCGHCDVVADLDWRINDTTVLKPDIAIICDATDDFITQPPVLIVEIMSPSTAMKDRHTKFEIYQEQGVKYYIIADTATRTSHCYILSGSEYKEAKLTTIEILAGCIIPIDIAKAMAAMKD